MWPVVRAPLSRQHPESCPHFSLPPLGMDHLVQTPSGVGGASAGDRTKPTPGELGKSVPCKNGLPTMWDQRDLCPHVHEKGHLSCWPLCEARRPVPFCMSCADTRSAQGAPGVPR